MKKVFLLLCFFSTSVFAQVLPANSPERQQLIAMGAEFSPEKPGDKLTVAVLGQDKIAFEKHPDRLVATVYFTREKKLDSSGELELFRLVNKLNQKYAYQFTLYDGYLTASLYNLGNHDPKGFAAIVRNLLRVESVFDANPRILELLNR
jgi:hypothetical protein